MEVDKVVMVEVPMLLVQLVFLVLKVDNLVEQILVVVDLVVVLVVQEVLHQLLEVLVVLVLLSSDIRYKRIV
tara:strand:- start:457 stop:672 length:216 start_codon:yes stop_codon:yes gene_type:complete